MENRSDPSTPVKTPDKSKPSLKSGEKAGSGSKHSNKSSPSVPAGTSPFSGSQARPPPTWAPSMTTTIPESNRSSSISAPPQGNVGHGGGRPASLSGLPTGTTSLLANRPSSISGLPQGSATLTSNRPASISGPSTGIAAPNAPGQALQIAAVPSSSTFGIEPPGVRLLKYNVEQTPEGEASLPARRAEAAQERRDRAAADRRVIPTSRNAMSREPEYNEASSPEVPLREELARRQRNGAENNEASSPEVPLRDELARRKRQEGGS